MGRVISELCEADPTVELVAGFDILGQSGDQFPVFSNPALCEVPADVVVDFSSPAALPALLEFGQRTHTPLVLATTGYSDEQIAQIETASHTLPIFRSANMSLGINVLLELVRTASAVLGDDYDIEIVERHHNKKLDAPSGTALMIADAAARQLAMRRNTPTSAKVSADRAISVRSASPLFGAAPLWATIRFWFAGRDEVIEISHHAASREIFANGALRPRNFSPR